MCILIRPDPACPPGVVVAQQGAVDEVSPVSILRPNKYIILRMRLLIVIIIIIIRIIILIILI